jgi:hypothetical protein
MQKQLCERITGRCYGSNLASHAKSAIMAAKYAPTITTVSAKPSRLIHRVVAEEE